MEPTSALREVFALVNEMSPYLLLGFLLAGLMHAFIPGAVYSRYLSGHNLRSVLYAALFGVPLPLCSCGVIPTAMSLRREGASKGATVSFLIATPETGVDSIIATYSLLGLPFAVIRPVAALCNAVLAGFFVNIVDGGKKHGAPVKPAVPDTAKNEKSPMEPAKNASFAGKLREALEYGYVEMMEDIGKWLVVGLVIAGLITIFVPDTLFEAFKDNTMMSMLLVLCIAIPMYICATGSIPIAVALMLKGLTPGAALVLLMAGPACNMASILVINKVLGRKTLTVYLLSILVCAISWGMIVDHVLPVDWFRNAVMANACCHEDGQEWFKIACTIVLCLLLLNALWNHFHHPHCHCHDSASDHQSHADGACCTVDEGEAAETTDIFEFSVKGLNCSHCCANATRVLKSLDGVEDAVVTLSTGRAQVKGTASQESIAEALASLGFKAVF